MNRRQLLIGTAAIAGAAALPVTAPAADPVDFMALVKQQNRLLAQLIEQRFTQIEERFAAALEDAMIYGRGTVLDSIDGSTRIEISREPLPFWKNAAVDPTWQQPRDDG